VLDVLWIDTAYSWCLACLDLVHGFIDLSDRRREGINNNNKNECHSNIIVDKLQGCRGRCG